MKISEAGSHGEGFVRGWIWRVALSISLLQVLLLFCF